MLPELRFVALVLLACACGNSKSSSESSGSGSGSSAPAGHVAAIAPNRCDGKPCPCKAGTKENAKDWSEACELEKPLVVQGVPCGVGRLEFHPDGKLSKCSLEAPVRVGPYDCRVGVGILWLHPDGKLKRCNVAGKYTVGKLEVAGNHWGAFDFETWETGALKEGELASPQKFNGHTCSEKVELYRDGSVYSCWIEEPLVDGALTLPKGTAALFGPDGKLIGYFPQQDIPYEGGVHKAGYPVCLVKDCNTTPE